MPKPAQDLTNRRFGKLVAVAKGGQLNNRTAWICNCDCGNSLRTRATSLLAGFTTSCGCYRVNIAKENIAGVGEKNFKNLLVNRYGKLLVIELGNKDHAGNFHWKCLCDCGRITYVRGAQLIGGRTKSCGCLVIENAKLLRVKYPDSSKIHGHTSRNGASPEYRAYRSMLDRCHNPKRLEFKNYGARGISVCDKWRFGDASLTGFQCFISDMGSRPRPDYSLDRIDPNGNYCAENCRWADWKTQARNKRKTHRVIYKGKPVCLAELVERGICSYNAAHYHTKIKGMSLQQAVDFIIARNEN